MTSLEIPIPELEQLFQNICKRKKNCIFIISKIQSLTHMKGLHEGMMSLLDQAISLNPTKSNTYFYKAVFLLELEKYQDALVLLDKALNINPKDKYTNYYKAQVLYKLNQKEEAIKFCEKELQIVPSCPHSHLLKGKISYDLGRYSEAVPSLEESLKLDSTNLLAYLVKAKALQKLGNLHEAKLFCETGLKIFPDKYQLHLLKGRICYELGEYLLAISSAEIAIKLNAKNPEAYVLKAMGACKLRRDEEAMRTFDEAIRLDPRNSVTIYLKKGMALFEICRYPEAINCFTHLITLGFRKGYYLRGKAYLHDNQLQLALEDLEQATVAIERGEIEGTEAKQLRELIKDYKKRIMEELKGIKESEMDQENKDPNLRTREDEAVTFKVKAKSLPLQENNSVITEFPMNPMTPRVVSQQKELNFKLIQSETKFNQVAEYSSTRCTEEQDRSSFLNIDSLKEIEEAKKRESCCAMF